MKSFRGWVQEWREYGELSDATLIARRAFVNNSFDGILTMVGVVMGSFFVGVQDATIVLVTGMSTALAIGISGGWGAYLAESAERRHEMSELEKFTLTNLHDSKIGRASRAAVVIVAAVDGLSPFLAAVLVLIPFFFTPLLPSVTVAYYTSIVVALVALFGLGSFLGKVSKANILMYGIKTAFAGVVCMALSFLLDLVAR
jgi:predicted membrane protein (TIGR00267 family)